MKHILENAPAAFGVFSYESHVSLLLPVRPSILRSGCLPCIGSRGGRGEWVPPDLSGRFAGAAPAAGGRRDRARFNLSLTGGESGGEG